MLAALNAFNPFNLIIYGNEFANENDINWSQGVSAGEVVIVNQDNTTDVLVTSNQREGMWWVKKYVEFTLGNPNDLKNVLTVKFFN